jgi:hypothetical protein
LDGRWGALVSGQFLSELLLGLLQGQIQGSAILAARLGQVGAAAAETTLPGSMG